MHFFQVKVGFLSGGTHSGSSRFGSQRKVNWQHEKVFAPEVHPSFTLFLIGVKADDIDQDPVARVTSEWKWFRPNSLHR